MAKKIMGTLKLQVPAGAANPSPPVGPALGQRGINIMEFCKAFNAKAAKLKSGSKEPGKVVAGSITGKQVREIAEAKMKDLNATSIEGAMLIIAGSARSMGIEVKSAFAGKELVSVKEAVALVKDNATAKFDETIEISLALGVDPRHADQMVRGTVDLPNGTGKSVRVAVFARGEKADEAKAAGADIVGAEDLTDMMAVVGRLGKVLGPRNLMPNPRVGTVTMDVKAAVESAKGGQVQFKAEKAGVVHAGIGKASFSAEQIEQNLLAFVDAVAKAKPAGAKGTYMKKISVSSTMGPGVSLNVDLRGAALLFLVSVFRIADLADFSCR